MVVAVHGGRGSLKGENQPRWVRLGGGGLHIRVRTIFHSEEASGKAIVRQASINSVDIEIPNKLVLKPQSMILTPDSDKLSSNLSSNTLVGVEISQVIVQEMHKSQCVENLAY